MPTRESLNQDLKVPEAYYNIQRGLSNQVFLFRTLLAAERGEFVGFQDACKVSKILEACPDLQGYLTKPWRAVRRQCVRGREKLT
jgi:hypothetical protein